MKKIIQIGILIVSIGLFFSCGTTKVETTDAEQNVTSPDVSSEKQNKDEDSDKISKNDAEHNSDSNNMTDVDNKESEVEKSSDKKPSKKPKKATSKKQKKVEEKPEEPPAPVIPVFDDWKYMGFGAEVPKEIEETVKAAPVDFIADGFKVYDVDTRNTVIFHVAGINVDQAEDKLEASVSNGAATANVLADISLEEYKASESGWVRLNLEYFADKLQVEEEGSDNYQALLKLLDQIYISYQIYRKK